MIEHKIDGLNARNKSIRIRKYLNWTSRVISREWEKRLKRPTEWEVMFPLSLIGLNRIEYVLVEPPVRIQCWIELERISIINHVHTAQLRAGNPIIAIAPSSDSIIILLETYVHHVNKLIVILIIINSLTIGRNEWNENSLFVFK